MRSRIHVRMFQAGQRGTLIALTESADTVELVVSESLAWKSRVESTRLLLLLEGEQLRKAVTPESSPQTSTGSLLKTLGPFPSTKKN
jgi:hypothetical protein